MVIAAPTAKALLPPDVPAASSSAASSAVERLSPWASLSSESVAVSADGSAASSIELDRAGAVLSSSDELSVSREVPEESPALLCREEPEPAELPEEELPLWLLPEELLPDELLPDELLPDELLPDAAVTIVAFISVLFPAV